MLCDMLIVNIIIIKTLLFLNETVFDRLELPKSY